MQILKSSNGKNVVFSSKPVTTEDFNTGDYLFLFLPESGEIYKYEMQKGFGEHWPTNQEVRWNFIRKFPYPDNGKDFLNHVQSLV